MPYTSKVKKKKKGENYYTAYTDLYGVIWIHVCTLLIVHMSECKKNLKKKKNASRQRSYDSHKISSRLATDYVIDDAIAMSVENFGHNMILISQFLIEILNLTYYLFSIKK